MCILYSVIGLQNNIIYDVLVNVRGQHVRPAFFKDWSLVQACSSGPLPGPGCSRCHTHLPFSDHITLEDA